MKLNNLDVAAQSLIEARVNQQPIDDLPESSRPSTPAEAEAVDDRVAEITGWPVLGWKVGCTSLASQKLLGADGPFAGRIYSVSDSGVPVPPKSIVSTPHLEGEFAFVMHRALAGNQDSFTPDQILQAVGELRPAIEVVGGRFTKFVGVPFLSIIADAGSNSHLVLGQPASTWDPADLPSQEATMSIDGALATSGSGQDVLDSPMNSLLWLANHLAGRGITIEAGHVVTTGTATKVTELPAGSTAVADFGPLGSVSTTFVK